MKYAVLIYMSPEAFAERAGPRADAFWAPFRAYHLALTEAGAILGGQALADAARAKAVSVRDGKPRVQDGPYADTKEQLAGFMVLEAGDLDQALAWAARCPVEDRGVLEVRPIMPVPGMEDAPPPGAEAPPATHVLLLYEDEASFFEATPEQQEQVLAAHGAFSAALDAAGALVGGDPLEASGTATTLRLRGGERLVQDGPFADTKEQLGGYYLLSCKSDAEAIDWAARCPSAAGGIVEVRATLRDGG